MSVLSKATTQDNYPGIEPFCGLLLCPASTVRLLWCVFACVCTCFTYCDHGISVATCGCIRHVPILTAKVSCVLAAAT